MSIYSGYVTTLISARVDHYSLSISVSWPHVVAVKCIVFVNFWTLG